MEEGNISKTSITKWKDNKKSAISITYDDGIIHQFTVARPIMNNIGFPGTFYVITGKIEGAALEKFIGRTPREIMDETVTIKMISDNFFERASAIGFIDNCRYLITSINYQSSKVVILQLCQIAKLWTNLLLYNKVYYNYSYV